MEVESFVFRYLWFLSFLPKDLRFIHIFFPEIHDSLFYVSASTTEYKYPDLDFTAALELAGYRPDITL